MFGIGRLRARYRLSRWVRLFYHTGYTAPGLVKASRVPNIQLDRAELVLETLGGRGLLPSGSVRVPGIVPSADLLLVHSAAYLEESAQPEALAHVFGLPPDWVDVDELLTAQRLAVGGTVAAARAAVAGGPAFVAVNLGGGFHHAQPERGSGFCVYNDIAIAIRALRRDGFEGRIAIIDLDFHQGDGNLVAFAADPTVLTYDVAGSVWSHVEAVAHQQIVLPSGTDDNSYLETLESTLPKALNDHRPALAFYVAGNDVLAGDHLGDFKLTPRGVLERDRRVVNAVRNAGASLVVTLGGGYSPNAWQCTVNALRWLLTDTQRARELRPPDLRRHFIKVFDAIDPLDLQRVEGDPLRFEDEDVLADLNQRRRRLLLEFYSKQGIEFAFEKYGVLKKIRRRGYVDLEFEMEAADPTRQLIRVRGRRGSGPEPFVLIELGVRRQPLKVPASVHPSGEVEALGVEWLMLQDPTAVFSLRRPRLPGQAHPGLGIAADMHELFVRICHRLGFAGVVDRPSYYHTAFRFRDRCYFVDPLLQGRFDAMRAVLGDLAMGDASQLVADNRLFLKDGTPVAWEPGDNVQPVSPALIAWFESAEYAGIARREELRLLAAGLHVREGGGSVAEQGEGPGR